MFNSTKPVLTLACLAPGRDVALRRPAPARERIHLRSQCFRIRRAVAIQYGVTVEDILSTARPARIAWPRMVVDYCAREITCATFEALAAGLGRKRSTIESGHKAVADQVDIQSPEGKRALAVMSLIDRDVSTAP